MKRDLDTYIQARNKTFAIGGAQPETSWSIGVITAEIGGRRGVWEAKPPVIDQLGVRGAL